MRSDDNNDRKNKVESLTMLQEIVLLLSRAHYRAAGYDNKIEKIIGFLACQFSSMKLGSSEPG